MATVIAGMITSVDPERVQLENRDVWDRSEHGLGCNGGGGRVDTTVFSL